MEICKQSSFYLGPWLKEFLIFSDGSQIVQSIANLQTLLFITEVQLISSCDQSHHLQLFTFKDKVEFWSYNCIVKEMVWNRSEKVDHLAYN